MNPSALPEVDRSRMPRSPVAAWLFLCLVGAVVVALGVAVRGNIPAQVAVACVAPLLASGLMQAIGSSCGAGLRRDRSRA